MIPALPFVPAVTAGRAPEPYASGMDSEGKPMKTSTLIAALVALVSAATPAIAPGMAAQAKPTMVADSCNGCAVEQPDAAALPPIPADCSGPNCATPTPPALKLAGCGGVGC
jgi:hypothetical protein